MTVYPRWNTNSQYGSGGIEVKLACQYRTIYFMLLASGFPMSEDIMQGENDFGSFLTDQRKSGPDTQVNRDRVDVDSRVRKYEIQIQIFYKPLGATVPSIRLTAVEETMNLYTTGGVK